MFANHSALAFFPTFVWVYDLLPADAERINASLGRRVERMVAAQTGLRVGHSWQTETDIHTLPEFEALAPFVDEGAMRIVDFLEFERHPLRVTGCWANVSPPGAFHHQHMHPNNFLSGVYYVQAPPGGDSINFHDPRLAAHVIAPHTRKASTKHASSVNINVQAGRLVFFLSWLEHSVSANQSNAQRMSVSFNLMFEQFDERVSRPRFKGKIGTSRGSET